LKYLPFEVEGSPHSTSTHTKKNKNYSENKNRCRLNGSLSKLAWTQKTTRAGIKPRTQQGKQIIKNASLGLIQNYKHKDVR